MLNICYVFVKKIDSRSCNLKRRLFDTFMRQDEKDMLSID